jgi:hypothetical protein
MRGFRVYDTYNFKDVDPVIDECRTAWRDSGHRLSYIGHVSRLSSTTMTSWFNGKTKRPQNASVSAFMGALGYERRWVKTAHMRTLVTKLAAKRKPNGKGS